VTTAQDDTQARSTPAHPFVTQNAQVWTLAATIPPALPAVRPIFTALGFTANTTKASVDVRAAGWGAKRPQSHRPGACGTVHI
jgi:hypothetical protein